ncbi:UDP-N-acetylmuramate dehydrogenase [Beggiatoa leptomitoformis]|uniref:UDP-N-acetylenolpyruvoylglucosamine reductase n=1 Tax=Beggiatoa leptomitoformis TaxID=288004 RepID=A0A2N9YCP8_9GAMM|nr:UDP-N-acetylmuramate dehydrogenase [Beggiatoa leptomitoformis]ALG66474.1 UDP-N-acetylmuramate dehydrogenase [Beggiatoa leptomitoformis]AUI68235.1 UDP-N-acetylmuramate dehydrogenase [Beggiatoa leptomitoformis]
MTVIIGHNPNFVPFNGRGTLRHNEPLSKHTSWRIGGPAEWFYEPADLEDLAQLMPQIPDTMPILWMGLGSNLLVRDGGVRGMVILTSGLLDDIIFVDEHTLRVEAGVSCAKVARLAVNAGLGGAEFLAGIPGTIGGALAMNAGAWGSDTWSIVRSVETVNRQGQHQRRSVTDYEVRYRHVKGPENEWFVAAVLKLLPAPVEEGQEKIKALLRQRGETQPVGLPSCGSVFRNPSNDHAARLIEQAGWKGRSIGGACVSEKHANFIINQQSASAADVEALITQIIVSVEQQYGIRLVPEVRIVGEY